MTKTLRKAILRIRNLKIKMTPSKINHREAIYISKESQTLEAY